MTSSTSEKAGLPYDRFPTGWFQVGWRAELAEQPIRPIRYFDQDLVLLRTESGVVQVMDAHCQHQGAHLGYGGWIEGESIVCPFHGWAWGTDGRNVMVPAEGCATNRRSIRTWPTHESNGIIWIWHDEDRRAPLWDPPADVDGYADGDFYPVHPACIKRWEDVKAKPQYVIENTADVEHLKWVHRADGPMRIVNFTTTGVQIDIVTSLIFGYGKEKTWLTPDGPVETRSELTARGVGYMLDHFLFPDDTWSIQGQTPIDHDRCDIFHTVLVRREGDEGHEPAGIAALRIKEQIKQIERDFKIWANMKYLPHAALMRTEAKAVTALRRWCAQFYPDGNADELETSLQHPQPVDVNV
jgi:nitrite reductase/ring-hydroxylating ferredoxin subunit